MNAVWDLDLALAPKMVLLSLADQALSWVMFPRTARSFMPVRCIIELTAGQHTP